MIEIEERARFDAATYERVKNKVNATMLDPIKVKGKTEKVLAYSVQGLKT